MIRSTQLQVDVSWIMIITQLPTYLDLVVQRCTAAAMSSTRQSMQRYPFDSGPGLMTRDFSFDIPFCWKQRSYAGGVYILYACYIWYVFGMIFTATVFRTQSGRFGSTCMHGSVFMPISLSSTYFSPLASRFILQLCEHVRACTGWWRHDGWVLCIFL